MNIKIEVDDFEIINSGSIIVENKQVVNFNFKDIYGGINLTSISSSLIEEFVSIVKTSR
jgi:hypothetical protein